MLESIFDKFVSLSAHKLKRDRNAGVLSEYCKIFQNTYFEEQLRTAGSFLRGFGLTVLIKFTLMNKRTSSIPEKRTKCFHC